MERDSVRYFLYLCTKPASDRLPYLDEHIRYNIWDQLHPCTWIKCMKCSRDLLQLTVDSTLVSVTDSPYFIKDGYAQCYDCNKKGQRVVAQKLSFIERIYNLTTYKLNYSILL
jgi:hypothetical protein